MRKDTATAITMINVKGTHLAVDLRPGDGSGPPLLLLNGIGANLEVFDPFLTEKEQMALLVHQFLRNGDCRSLYLVRSLCEHQP